MAREASDATLLRRGRAANRVLRTEAAEARQDVMKERLRADRLQAEVREWKSRFDLLLKLSGQKLGEEGRGG